MSNTLLTLRQRVRSSIGDGYREAVTTAIGAGVTVVSTNFNKWDGGKDDYYSTPEMFVYIEDKANAGVSRVTSDYATSGGTLTVRGANLTTDGANLATVQVTKFNPDNYLAAIQRAIRNLVKVANVPVDDYTLISGNMAPNSHFEDFATASYPTFWRNSNATTGADTTADYLRGGAKSCKVTASAADGYLYLGDIQYKPILDFAGGTATFRAWAFPQVANDAFLDVYTKTISGTEATTSSTTTCPASTHTLLEVEDVSIPDSLFAIQFRLRVLTNTKWCYFDNARVTGLSTTHYLLPNNFRVGGAQLRNVSIQTTGLSDYPCDDLQIVNERPVEGFEVPEIQMADTNRYKFLKLPRYYSNTT